MKRSRLILAAVAALALSGCDAGTRCSKGLESAQTDLQHLSEGRVLLRVSSDLLAARNLVNVAERNRTTKDFQSCATNVGKARKYLRQLSWS